MIVCLNIAALQCDYAVLALVTITGNTKLVKKEEKLVKKEERRVNVFVTD